MLRNLGSDRNMKNKKLFKVLNFDLNQSILEEEEIEVTAGQVLEFRISTKR
jgi:hypothetical protein